VAQTLAFAESELWVFCLYQIDLKVSLRRKKVAKNNIGPAIVWLAE
jgi:hypothetical protein